MTTESDVGDWRMNQDSNATQVQKAPCGLQYRAWSVEALSLQWKQGGEYIRQVPVPRGSAMGGNVEGMLRSHSR